MKRPILYLLLSYATVILKPVLPVLADVTAHILWYSHHMATVHYDHGKYHLHYDMLEAAKKDSGNKSPVLPKAVDMGSEHLATSQEYDFHICAPTQTHYPHWLMRLPSADACRDYPPPEDRA